MNEIEIFEKANILTKNKKYKEAFNMLKPLLETGYEEMALFQIGKSYMREGKEERAQIYFDELISLGPDYAEDVYLWLGKYSLNNNNLSEAEKYFDLATQTTSSDKTDILIEECHLYYYIKRLEKAEKLLNIVLKDDPKNSDALYLLAKINNYEGNTKEAINNLNKVIDNHDYKRINAYSLLIDINKKLSNKNEVNYLKECLKDIKNDGIDNKALIEEANTYLANGSYLEARDCFSKLVDNNIDLSASYAGLNSADLVIDGDNYLKTGEYDLAFNCYKKLFRMKKCLSHALVGLKITRALKTGDNYLLEGSVTKAINTYQTLIDPKTYKNMDEAKLEIMGALLYYNRTRIINYHNNVYNNSDKEPSLTYIGSIYLELGAYAKAKEFYIRSIDDDKNIAEAVAGLIAIKIKNNDLDGLDDFFNFYSNKLSRKEYVRIRSYIDYKINNDSKRDKEVIDYIINNQKKAFAKDIDIAALYYQIQKEVDDGVLVSGNGDELSYTYYVDCNEKIGINRNQPTNSVKVFCFMEKKYIISMYPSVYDNEAIILKEKVKKIEK